MTLDGSPTDGKSDRIDALGGHSGEVSLIDPSRPMLFQCLIHLLFKVFNREFLRSRAHPGRLVETSL